MVKRIRGCMFIGLVIVGLPATMATSWVSAQPPTPVGKADAPLVVDGTVRQVFRSPRQSRTDYLVEIEVQKSEGRRVPSTTARTAFPGPGELVYVHVFQRTDRAGQLLAGDAYGMIPSERAQVRAYLVPRPQGGWEGAYPDWLELTSNVPAEPLPADPAPPLAEAPLEQPATSVLGITTETTKVQGRVVVRVTSVERRSAAHQAGVEVGDVIVGVNGAAVESAEQLEQVARAGAPFSLVVLDVRTGRAAQVQVVPAASAPSPSAKTPAAPSASPPRASLGVSAESVRLGDRSALKVTRVTPGSPAEKAGLEPGDVIVEADGVPITAPEQLVGAVRKSGPTLELTVRDSRTGRDTPVQVALGGATPPAAIPAGPITPPVESGNSQLGIVSEMALFNDEFAVKVAEVEAGSPAARAGLRPGVLIIEVNGQTVLHPDDLMDAVRKSGRTARLTIVDPASGRKDTVDVTQ